MRANREGLAAMVPGAIPIGAARGGLQAIALAGSEAEGEEQQQEAGPEE